MQMLAAYGPTEYLVLLVVFGGGFLAYKLVRRMIYGATRDAIRDERRRDG